MYLITSTPYGVNTDCLMVCGHRAEFSWEEEKMTEQIENVEEYRHKLKVNREFVHRRYCRLPRTHNPHLDHHENKT